MNNNKPPILFASTIEENGTGKPLEGEAVSKTIKANQLAWVHLDATHPECRHWIENEVSYLDNIILDALLAEETRPRILEFKNGVLLILRGVNLNENAEPEDMVSTRIWVDPARIITLQVRNLKAIHDIQERIETANGPKNAGEFLTMISSRLFERMEPTFSELDDKLDDIEEKVIEDPEPSERKEITTIRKQAIIFRRYIIPQRDVMMQLRTSELPFLDQHHKRKIQENLDRLIRYIEDLDAIRERAQIVKDELSTILADRLNKNMYILSVIAAIFLPLGFLTGLLGINVGGIPGAENPASFWVFCFLLITLVAGQVIIFKKLKWF